MRSILELFEVKSVQLAQSNDDAIVLLNKRHFDCVFVDNMSRKENGLELVKHVRHQKKDALKEIPIILCTAFTGRKSITNARDAGVTEILAKPVSPVQIMEKMENAIFNKRNFVDIDVYAGPDRRRRASEYAAEEDRRHAGELPSKENERGD